mmetsp:Transcript_55872/g.120850  ORF Transcript_55872/g.120850 Transcript_55872/m.120850 type:complete len:319 (-) Transcript_55872:222-1178(-)
MPAAGENKVWLAAGIAAGIGAGIGAAAGLALGARWWRRRGDDDKEIEDLMKVIEQSFSEREVEDELPLRPVHFILRPQADPRLDFSMFVRYDPHPRHKTGAIMIVIPGGNYDVSEVKSGEGQSVAQWLVSLGITAVVLQHRCVSEGHYWPAPFEDWSLCALKVKRGAPSWGCDPNQIGVMGFSAGGHLAAFAALKGHDLIKPKLQVLLYPAINTLSPAENDAMEPWRPEQGYPCKEESIHLLGNEKAPDTFLVGIEADEYCPIKENTDPYSKVLKKMRVPCEYVVNREEDETHGCGLQDWWTTPCKKWLQDRGFALKD